MTPARKNSRFWPANLVAQTRAKLSFVQLEPPKYLVSSEALNSIFTRNSSSYYVISSMPKLERSSRFGLLEITGHFRVTDMPTVHNLGSCFSNLGHCLELFVGTFLRALQSNLSLCLTVSLVLLYEPYTVISTSV
jgi:hypothetical protein